MTLVTHIVGVTQLFVSNNVCHQQDTVVRTGTVGDKGLIQQSV